MISSKIALIKLFVSAILISGFIGSILKTYRDYKTIKLNNQILATDLGKLETAIEVQSQTILSYRNKLNDYEKSYREYEKDLKNIRDAQIDAHKETQDLLKLFSSVDIQKELNKDPEGVKKIVNFGSSNIFRLFECATSEADSNKNCPTGTISSTDEYNNTETRAD